MLKYILLGLHRFASLQHVPVLGVTLSSDLTMDKYVSNFCLADFYRLRQLRRVRRSLESESTWRRWSMPSLLLASTTVMYCWRLRLTSYSISWMWLHVLLVIQESSIAVSGNLCMSTFNGSTCRNERSSSLC